MNRVDRIVLDPNRTYACTRTARTGVRVTVSQTIWDTSTADWLAVCTTAAASFTGRISSYLTMYWLFHFELLSSYIHIVVFFNILTVISCTSQVVGTWVCWSSFSSIEVLISFCCDKICTYTAMLRSLNIYDNYLYCYVHLCHLLG